MIITPNQIADYQNLVGRLILNQIHKHPAIMEAIIKDKQADVRITVNGQELDLEAFIQRWQSDVSRMIQKEAASQVEEKFNVVLEKIEDFQEALRDELRRLDGE